MLQITRRQFLQISGAALAVTLGSGVTAGVALLSTAPMYSNAPSAPVSGKSPERRAKVNEAVPALVVSWGDVGQIPLSIS